MRHTTSGRQYETHREHGGTTVVDAETRETIAFVHDNGYAESPLPTCSGETVDDLMTRHFGGERSHGVGG